MKRRRVLIMIDTASRDALSQLLIARYLTRKGVEVLLCNQLTQVAMCERYRPDVLFTTWTVVHGVGEYLQRIRHRTRIVLVDQEGGRLGPAAFKRTMLAYDRAKYRVAGAATRVIAWGSLQARWLKELGCVDGERIVITGCPRLDPYRVPHGASGDGSKYIGVTLRGDVVTSLPAGIMRAVFQSLFVNPDDGLSASLPSRAQYEDWVWQTIAVTRHMFKMAMELSRRTPARIVMRPGPWEVSDVYAFLPKELARVSIDPGTLQHEYVKNAFVTIDESSTLGLESLLAGVPVVSLNALIPRLEDHVGGEDGARFNAPFRVFYWRPGTLEEAVDHVLRAERGELGLTPTPDAFRQYLSDCFDWPSSRPASFRTGDLLLELLDLPRGCEPEPCEDGGRDRLPGLKRAIYRVPGSAHASTALNWFQCRVWSRHRESLRRYHYFDADYPYRRSLDGLFTALWNAYEAR